MSRRLHVREVANRTALGSDSSGASVRTQALGDRGLQLARNLLFLGTMQVSGAEAATSSMFSYDRASGTSRQVLSQPRSSTAVVDTQRDAVAAAGPPMEYQPRLDQLRSFGVEDGVDLNESSESDFFSFLALDPPLGRASLVLLDNGNLRALWKGTAGQVGVQFFGNGTVQYVISRVTDSAESTHSAGRDRLWGLLEVIRDEFRERR